MDERSKGVYAAVLKYDHHDETGVWFGELAPEGMTQANGKPYPGVVVIPRVIWDNNDQPKEITIGFKFGKHDYVQIFDDEKVSLVNAKEDTPFAIPPLQEIGKKGN